MNWQNLRLKARARYLAVTGIILAIVLSAAVAVTFARRDDTSAVVAAKPATAATTAGFFTPTEHQLAQMTIEPVEAHTFRTEHQTEGKIAVDEDRATLVFSPYSGRVTRLFVKPGEMVKAGEPLFTVEAPDMVQAQNDFIAATASLNKARAALDLARLVEGQNKQLYDQKAGPLRDLQTSQAATTAAINDLQTAQIGLEAVRNRLRILGKTDGEIETFARTGNISPQATIYTPIGGTVVQRKVGPGQYVNTTSNSPAANDATFIIGDLSTVWLIGYVRESEAPNVKVGQPIRFSVLAFPDRTFTARIDYVATALDPTTRRLTVRATVDNKDGLFRPEMFASVTVATSEDLNSAAVPRAAILYEGNVARLWVMRPDKTAEMRKVRIGLSDGNTVQVTEGLAVGERVVVKGTLFVDRAGAGT